VTRESESASKHHRLGKRAKNARAICAEKSEAYRYRDKEKEESEKGGDEEGGVPPSPVASGCCAGVPHFPAGIGSNPYSVKDGAAVRTRPRML